MTTGWRTVRVRDLISAGVLQVSDGYRVTNRELGAEGVPFVRGGDIGGSGQINHEVDDHILPEFYDRVANKLTRPGDVAFITKGTVGRVGFVRDDQPRMVFAPQVCYWRVLDTEQLDPRFVFYLLSGAEFQANLDAVKTHGSMVADYVSIADQQTFLLTIPPIDDQRAIADVLGAMEDRIGLNTRTQLTLAQMGDVIFRQWCDQQPLTDQTTRLAEHVVFVKGLSYQGLGLSDEGVPLYNLNSIEAGGGYKDAGIKYYTGAYRERHIARRGDLLIANTDLTQARRVIGCGAIVPSYSEPIGLYSHHLFLARPHPRSPISARFVYHLLRLPRVRAQVRGCVNGTTVGMISEDALSRVTFVLPSWDALSEFEAVSQELAMKSESLEVDSQKLAKVGERLLPRLLSGELRIRGAESLIAAVA